MRRRLWTAVWLAAALGAAVAAVPAQATTVAGASPTTVAVVDTGVDPSQPTLSGRLVAGWDVLGDDSATGDSAWHGTAVASIIAGLPGVEPACDACSIMPVKALDASGEGSDAAVARGITWAVEHGARVVNLSLEGPSEAPVLRTAIRAAFHRGVVIVAAAGNDGTSAPTYPAADPFAIGVAATNTQDRLYPWSNRGSWVTLAAPGINLSGVPGGGTFDFEGTSSAAAVVSGVAARCIAEAPTLTPTLVRQALVRGADRITGARFGRIDVERTLALCEQLASTTSGA
jgi:thermitase